MIEERRGDHEPGVDGAADDATERVPGAIIEPIVKRVEALLGEIFRGAIVEVRVELVYDRLVAQHREEASGKGFFGFCKKAKCFQRVILDKEVRVKNTYTEWPHMSIWST